MSIVARNLVKSYGELRAVDGVSFEIPGPGVLGLIGPNGAGKSTTLRILTSFLAPTSGTAAIAGFDCRAQSQQVRQHLGYLPETSPLYPDARIDEFLAFRAKLKRVPRRFRRAEIDRCLQACGLQNARRRLIGRLSHGFRRRVALADSLLHDPPVLILDEPTAGLDPLQVRQFRDLLAGLAHDHTILLSTHLLAEAEAVCDRVLILSQGQLVEDIDLQSAKSAPVCHLEVEGPEWALRQYIASFHEVEDVNLLELTGAWNRFEIRLKSTADIRAQLAEGCHERGWPIRELSLQRLSLEQQFVRSVFGEQRKAA